MGVGEQLDRQVPSIHGATIPLQPEPHVLLPHAIFRQGIGPEVIPLFMPSVAPFACCPRLPPAERMASLLSGVLRQASEEAVDSGSVLDMLEEPGLSSLHDRCCVSTRLIIRHFR